GWATTGPGPTRSGRPPGSPIASCAASPPTGGTGTGGAFSGRRRAGRSGARQSLDDVVLSGVDADHVPADPAGPRQRQARDGGRHVLGGGEPSARIAAAGLLEEILRERDLP